MIFVCSKFRVVWPPKKEAHTKKRVPFPGATISKWSSRVKKRGTFRPIKKPNKEPIPDVGRGGRPKLAGHLKCSAEPALFVPHTGAFSLNHFPQLMPFEHFHVMRYFDCDCHACLQPRRTSALAFHFFLLMFPHLMHTYAGPHCCLLCFIVLPRCRFLDLEIDAFFFCPVAPCVVAMSTVPA